MEVVITETATATVVWSVHNFMQSIPRYLGHISGDAGKTEQFPPTGKDRIDSLGFTGYRLVIKIKHM